MSLCGVTSAVACKIALSLYENVYLYYIERDLVTRITLAFYLIVKRGMNGPSKDKAESIGDYL
ncbi:hypothetical protein [Bacteroides thetaiotaomicron]|uniref:hypothetical protein n=1 Tax=Bacteroides thetaiotaomicron TaxID=818 RepID=UPI001F196356|nr:hypothetical protein [Bacteroides thetaiotaomicron]